jgi:hypothetical protein
LGELSNFSDIKGWMGNLPRERQVKKLIIGKLLKVFPEKISVDFVVYSRKSAR